MSAISAFLQRVFFKEIKQDPKEVWIKRAKKLGELSTGTITRKSGKLSYYILSPRTDSNPCQAMSDSVVILSHPISRKAKYFFSESGRAKSYLGHGCTVVAFDYNGFGESDRIDLFYWRDVVAVVDHVKKTFPNKKLILHGASFGAFHIIRATKALPNASVVVLENVNKSLMDYWKRWPTTRLLVRVLEFARMPAIRDMDVQQVFSKFERGDLYMHFIACEKDDMTTLEEMRDLYESLSTANKSFSVFEGAGHLAAPIKDPVRYQSMLLNRGYPSC